MEYMGIIDYLVLIVVVSVSLVIGIFFGRKKQDSKDYTNGKGKLGVIPVGLSMTVSFISAITIQGTPAEVYLYGPEFILTVASSWGCILAAFTFVPLFCRLDIESIYTYLELRFKNKGLVLMAYIFGIILPTAYMGVTTFGPAAALESMTGIPTWINIFTMMAICTVYTSIGGIKAVVWTDAFQALVMVLGLIAVIFVGIMKLGSDTSVWEELHKRSRLDFHLTPDPRERVNIWILTLGKGLNWLSYFALQPALMRYRAVGTEARAMKVVAFSSVGFVMLMTLSGCAGIIVYAYYSYLGCGPLAAGHVYSSNQVISYYVADVLNFPGLPGLFIAALIAATFSSISSAQNAISAILWQDILVPYTKGIKDVTKTLLMKITVVVFGLLSTAIAFLSKGLGGSLAQVSAMLLSVFGGPVFGLFIVGALFPFVSGTSAFLGTLSSCVVCCWLAIGNKLHGNSWTQPILITEDCGLNKNLTSLLYSDNETLSSTATVSVENDDVWQDIFSISPFLYGIFGIVINVAISTVSTVVPRLRQTSVDKSLVFPFVASLMSLNGSDNKPPSENTNKKTDFGLSGPIKNSSTHDYEQYNEKDITENHDLLTCGSKTQSYNI